MKLPWFIIKRLIKSDFSKYGVWWGKLSGTEFLVVAMDCDPEDPYGDPEIKLFVDRIKNDYDPECFVKFYHIDEVLERIRELTR